VLQKTCNLWRNWADIDDSFESVKSIADYFSQNQDRIAPKAGPGHWNDPDTLLLGNFGLSYEQSKHQLAVWAVLAAPFLISNDLRSISPEIKELLLNREIIAVDQDVLGIQGKLVSKGNNIEVWARPVTPIVRGQHSYAVAFVSRRADGHGFPFNVTLKDLNLSNEFGYQIKASKPFHSQTSRNLN
jgi:alpha-galactosidase